MERYCGHRKHCPAASACILIIQLVIQYISPAFFYGRNLDISFGQHAYTAFSAALFHIDNEKNINCSLDYRCYIDLSLTTHMKRIVLFGWPGLIVLIIFIIGIIVVVGFLLKLLFMLLPALVIIILVYFLFRSLNRMKGKR